MYLNKGTKLEKTKWMLKNLKLMIVGKKTPESE